MWGIPIVARPEADRYSLSRGRAAVDKNALVAELIYWSNVGCIEISGDYLAKTRKA